MYDPQAGGDDGHDRIKGIQDILTFQKVSEKFYTRVVSNSGLVKRGKAVSDEIGYAVEYAARIFIRAGIQAALADALNLSIGEAEYTGRDTCKIAALLITNACLLHRRLLQVPHMRWLADLNEVGGSDDPCSVLDNAWTSILERDYAPVFEPALSVIKTLPRDHTTGRAICHMADCANRIADDLSELGYDHSGPLYHSILGTAKSDSANYTHNVSAVLLARMALSRDLTDWSDPDAVGRLRIMDPACGTGTLLMAALQTAKHRMGYEGQDTEYKSMIHRRLVDDVLCGLDINRHAVQLAACNLTLGAPTIDYSNMHLYTMKHGPQADGTVRAGSVEILRATTHNDTMRAFIQPLRNVDDLGAEHVDRAVPVEFPLNGLSLIIMNPPFGSNQARSRKFSPDVVKRMQKNELAIMGELDHRDPAAGETIDVNSIRTFFTPLANRLLDQKSGTLAQVLPVTACIGASGLVERKFLADRFHVECIITTHDPRRPNFSYKTSIHESLMVCRRYDGAKPPTKFVSLRRMPETISEAIKVADAVSDGDAGGWGSTCIWPAERMAAGDWTPVQWYDAELAGVVRDLEESPLLEKVGVRHEVGPAGRRIHDAYEECGPDDPDAVMIFDSIRADLRRTIRGTPESYHRPKASKRKLAARYWGMRSSLLVAIRFRTTTSRLTAICADHPSVGKGWVPVSVRDEREAGALAVWWNSTPCMMMMLNRRSKTLDYPKWSLEHLREIRIPKPDNPGWQHLYETCRTVRDMEVRPLHDAANDPVRKMIDAAAARILGVEPEVIAGWCERLCSEPTIQGNRT